MALTSRSPTRVFPRISLTQQFCPEVSSLAELKLAALAFVEQAASQGLNYIEVQVPFLSLAQQVQQPVLATIETVIAGITLGTKLTQVKVNLIARLITVSAISDSDLFAKQLQDILLMRPKLAGVALSMATAITHQASLPLLLNCCGQNQWPLWLTQVGHDQPENQQHQIADLLHQLKPTRISCDWATAQTLLPKMDYCQSHWLVEPIAPFSMIELAQQAQQLQQQCQSRLAIEVKSFEAFEVKALEMKALENDSVEQESQHEASAYQAWLMQQAMLVSYLAESEQRALYYRLAG